MRGRPGFLVLAGAGINCERESAAALGLAGLGARTVHLLELVRRPRLLRDAQGLFLPGGFSFGDDPAAGRALALVLERRLGDGLARFVSDGKPVLGVCNGFQALVETGLLPDGAVGGRRAALAENAGGRFIDDWVEVRVEPEAASASPWLDGLGGESLSLPVRHKEGRLLLRGGPAPGRAALRYARDVNGSQGRIAGLVDPTGLVLGLMPHPEAAVRPFASPLGLHGRGSAHGLRLFRAVARSLRA